jgi:primosomal protein N' (replication factor Y)
MPGQAVLKVAVPVPLAGLFDYLPPADGASPAPGARVLVRFGRRRLVGLVMSEAGDSAVEPDRLQRVERVLDEGRPLFDRHLLELLEWCARYYHHPAGEVVANAIPPALRKSSGLWPEPESVYRLTPSGHERLGEGQGRAPVQWELLELLSNGPQGPDRLREWRGTWRSMMRKAMAAGWVSEEEALPTVLETAPGPELNQEQAAALESIRGDFGRFRCHLLDGVTGSGKTEVYLRLIEEVIRDGRQVLVLVPEIGLTSQLVDRMRRRLGIEPAVSHSGLAEGERARIWERARRGNAPLLLGTRSALFLPMPRPGLIIMDESHDPSFKQQEGFRFSARDVAVKRASMLDIPVVLGTATPSLETLHNARHGRYTWNRLRTRATGARQPAWRVLDLRQQTVTAGMSERVLQAIGERLERDEQVLVFLNRRGYAPVLLCHDCGWHAACHRCDANMTWHRGERALVCHHCGHRTSIPRFCPECRADALESAGAGTEQLEHHLAERFGATRLFRFDRDMTRRKGAFEQMVQEVRGGEPAILVGTQMLAKGHHFPRVTLAVIVNLDQALYSADFRALERMGQVMMQVAGRSGRAEQAGEVVLQTHHPDHPMLELLFRQGYEAFAEAMLEERRLASLPPFSAQATLRAEAASREEVQGFLNEARSLFAENTTRIHGPFPALMERRGGRVRWYLLLQNPKRPGLQASLEPWLEALRALPGSRRVRWALDVDPQDF